MTDGQVRKMNDWIDAHGEEMAAELQGFARVPSVSRADLGREGAPFGPDCRAMLDYALERARNMGFETVDHEGYAGSACLGDMGRAIGFLGHLDVVPVGDGWLYPPFAATRQGDFLIGRGVSDDKCACVMSLYLMRMFRELNLPLRHGLRAVFGLSEETGMQDMDHFVTTGHVPMVSLVPDSAFPVCQAQKGSLSAWISIAPGGELSGLYAGEAVNIVPPEARVAVRVSAREARAALEGMEPELYTVEEREDGCLLAAHGRPAHAAAPENGLNAVHLLARALCRLPLKDEASRRAAQAMLKISEGYYGEYAGIAAEDPVSGQTTLNVGLARDEGGAFRLGLDARLSIASDPAAMEKACRDAVAALGFTVDSMSTTQPFSLPDDDPAMNALMSAYREATGRDDPPYAMGGGTYSRVVPNAITFGPGMKDAACRPEGLPEGHGGAHQCDEFLHIPTWLTAVKVYALAVARLDEALE